MAIKPTKKTDTSKVTKKEEDAEEEDESADMEEEADDEAEDSEDSDSTDEEDEENDDSSSTDETDWEAEAAREKERADNAERLLAGGAFKKRKAKRENKDTEADDEEDEGDELDLNAPMTVGTFLKLQKDQQKSTQLEQAFEIAKKHTSSEAEARAAVQFLRSRVTRTDDLEEDVLFAIAGMNRKRTAKKVGEVLRANKSNKTVSRDVASTHRDGDQTSAPRGSSQDQAALKAAGMSWDSSMKAYKKPLAGGKKFLYYDPKTKKRWVKNAQ